MADTNPTVAVVDYGMGNLHSVVNALRAVADRETVALCHDPEALLRAERVVFPGQGAMPDCMQHLRESGLGEALREVARTKPFLGVCMGEQMLFGRSEEGNVDGMGLLPGRVVRFPRPLPADPAAPQVQTLVRHKVPHMGWNRVHRTSDHPLWDGIEQDAYFYFVHSYYVVPDEPGLTFATCWHGLDFTCAVGRGNIFATQFHPEKSAARGLRLYRNFLSWRP